MRYGFGIDIGSSLVKFACFEETGKLMKKWSIPTTKEQGVSALLPAIAEEIDRCMREGRLLEDDILGIGVGIPGPVNSSGTVNKCVNLGWGVFNIDRTLAGLTGLHVVSTNVANAAALGECWAGSGKGCRELVYIAMNTGIGGAVISNGRMILGAHGGSGELGHMTVNRQETTPCTCGKRGCLEQYFSPTGIVTLTRKQLTATPLSSLRLKRVIELEDVMLAAQKGDKAAVEAVNKACDYAGEMLANVCCVTNPDNIILGGQLAKHKLLADGVAKYFGKYVFHANKDVRFSLAALGEDAAVYGAFKLVLDSCG